jgi:nondiscriminating aspartyl-tRNA synthetase
VATSTPITLDGKKLVGSISDTELRENIGGEITFSACIHKIREMRSFAFVLLRTGRYVFQSVYSAEACKDSLDEIKEGCYVKIKGKVAADARAAYGLEITLTSIVLLSKPAAEYPLHVSDKRLQCQIETNLQYRQAALRNPYERAVFKISEGICSAFRTFMINNDFTEIHSPKIVSAGAEGGANIFKLKYFDKPAFLAQSPQFYKQSAVAFFDRVFEIGSVYRAEKHNTTRHINEYIGLDFEMGFIDNIYDVMQMETALLKFVIEKLAADYQNELTILGTTLPVIGEIPSLTFFDALEALGQGGRTGKIDFEPEDEVRICEYVKEKFGSDFVFITHYPSATRAFYTMDDPENPKLSLSFDLLFKGLEITSGAQRIHGYGEQVAKMQRMGLNPEDFKSYLDAHKYGLPPHGGLGIGLERLVMKFLGLPNIRQASLFPRDITHLDP